MKYIICYSLGGSSVSSYFSAIVKELNVRGHDVTVVTWGSGERIFEKQIDVLKFPSIRPTRLTDFLFLCRAVKKLKPDCIIANFASVNLCMIVAWLFNVKNRCVYLHTVSSAIAFDGNNGLKPRFQRLRKTCVLRLSTCCFVNSDAMKEDANRCYRVSLSKIYKFNLLTKSIKIKEMKRVNNMISFIGRFDPSKGQEDLIKALPIIVERGYNPHVVFCGDGPLFEKNKALAEQLGVNHFCVFKGYVPIDEVYDVLQESMIMVSGSRHEAFGLTNVESLSVGTPVVTTGVDGIQDIITDGENGLYYHMGDHEDLANKIIILLADHVKWHKLSQNATLIFEERFSLDNNIPRHVDRYQEIFRR